MLKGVTDSSSEQLVPITPGVTDPSFIVIKAGSHLGGLGDRQHRWSPDAFAHLAQQSKYVEKAFQDQVLS